MNPPIKPGFAIISVLVIAIIAAPLALSLAGCTKAVADRPVPASETLPARAVGTIDGDYAASMWIDPATGCQYLMSYRGGITPRMASTGSSRTSNPQMGCP